VKVISLDCETNGLGGRAFCVAAILSDDSGELESWTARSPICGEVNGWVAEHVLPALTDVPEDHSNYWRLVVRWQEWYAKVREQHPDVLVLAHVAWPVETTFLRDAHAENLFAGPYPLIDVAPLLLAAGHDPTSVDNYLVAHGLPKPEGSPHHPLYDARATGRAFRHLVDRARSLWGSARDERRTA
jgi:hypothetical protein